MNVLFEGDADATLLVVGNDLKTVECNDDAEAGANINPLVTLANPAEGAYAVYVGRLDPSQAGQGQADGDRRRGRQARRAGAGQEVEQRSEEQQP